MGKKDKNNDGGWSRTVDPGQHKGRGDVKPLTINLEGDAFRILRATVPKSRTGQFMSRLIFEYQAVKEERQRWIDQAEEKQKAELTTNA